MASYPSALASFTTWVDGVDYVAASIPNDIQNEVVAIETELGTDVAGTATDLKTRLAVEHNDDGTHGDITVTTATIPNTGLHILDTDASHDLIVAPGSNLTADRTLTLTTGDADRTVTLSGNPTLDDWFDQSVKTTATPTFAGLTVDGASGNTLVVDTDTLVVDATNHRVGVGTVPESTLHIKRSGATSILNIENTGNGNISGILFTRERLAGTGTPGAWIRMRSDTSTNKGFLEFRADSSVGSDLTGDPMMAIESGFVSIGTEVFSGQLTVLAASASTVGLVVDTAASPTADIAQFQVNGTSKIRFGDAITGEMLEVVGNIISRGTDWTIRTSAADNSWLSITYGNGLFVAVANTGTGNRVMTSPDGINWTIRTSAADNGWRSVTYGNGLFVAVANTGTGNRVMTSPDGINWTIRTSAADNNWRSVTYGNGLFVAVADTGTGNRVMTSPDGINWTIRTSAADNNWLSVTYGNGLFVAVAYSGTGNRVMTSPDGINWTIRTSAADNGWYGVTYGNGLFVAVANTGTGNRVMTSPDGINWTIRTSAADNGWLNVTYGNGLFVAIANTGTGNRVMTSGKQIEQLDYLN